MTRSSTRHLTVLLSALTLLVTTAAMPSPVDRAAAAPAAPAAPPEPPLTVSTVVSGLTAPWDLTFTPGGNLLYDLKAGSIWVRRTNGQNAKLAADFSDLFVGSETGLMGMVVDPSFSRNRLLYTCQGFTDGSTTDIRVIKWQLDAGLTSAVRVGTPLVRGLPVTSGRHGGCRLRFDNSKLLYVGTGDAATGTNPQNLTSLGGKVLRITTTGAPAPGNPFLSSPNPATRLIFTYGHRNVQGLALRPGTNQMWSVEQGTSRDDEVNRLVAGTNYGYDPVPGQVGDPAYNESVPMTDLVKYPSAKPAVYTTGSSTLALSGGTWLSGPQWGSRNGTFVAAALKAQTVRVLTIAGTDTLSSVGSMSVLTEQFGRLRSPQLGPDGALYVSTSNGTDDKIVKVTSPTGYDPRCRTATSPAPSTVGTATTRNGTSAYVVGTGGGVYRRFDTGTAPFQYLSGKTAYGAAAVSWDRVRTDVFITGTNGNLYQRFYDGRNWAPRWINLGGQLTSSPSVVSLGSRNLMVLARGSSGHLWMKRFTGTAWTGWTDLGGVLTAAPSAAVDVGRTGVRVAVRASDGTFGHLELGPGGVPTGGFTNDGLPICSAPAISTGPDRTDPFPLAYVDADRHVYVVRNGVTQALGGFIVGSVGLVTTGTGATTGYSVYGRGPGDALYVYDARSGPGTWRSLGGTLR